MESSGIGGCGCNGVLATRVLSLVEGVRGKDERGWVEPTVVIVGTVVVPETVVTLVPLRVSRDVATPSRRAKN